MRDQFAVVGVGMSAGGLAAATAFLKAAPAKSGMAFVVVQHLEPTRKSALAELLARETTMPVVEIEDGMKVEPDHVYVIVPAKTLLIEKGVLRLVEPAEPRGHRHPIDRFFTALANDRTTRAVAVVLSGAGSNGSAGIQDIKLAGGLCVAQKPESAQFDSMPQNAIASGAVDYVLTPEAMAPAIVKYLHHTAVNLNGRQASRADIDDVLALLRARAGHDFRQYKPSTLTRRIHRRMGLAGLDQLDDYMGRLRDDPSEVAQLVNDLMINVTGFFRDPEAWAALDKEVVLPVIAKASADQAIRAWVPACSTGEEAYTIAMLLAERSDVSGKRLKIKIFATDPADRNLAAARKGVYPGSMVESLEPDRLQRFFDKEGDAYRVKPDIRELVVFAPQNLLTDPPYSKMDLVSCRNLLIYLETEAQERVLSLAHFALTEGGFLFLGNAETVGRREHLFEVVSKRWRIYRRTGPARASMIDFATWPGRAPPTGEPANASKLAEVAARSLAERFAPASVVTDSRHRVHHFHGRTDDWLAQPSGPPTFDLLALARDGLRLAVRRAVAKAAAGETVTVSVGRGPDGKPCSVTASPLERVADDQGLILVSFSAATAAAKDTPSKREPERDVDEELKSARDEIQATVEQYETTNEELKAANEEVTSVNEELQSTNEELEASKEELQSLNEELNAVNSQLERKVHELEETRDDLRNLLAGNNVATLFLDTRLRIKWFSPDVKSLLNLVEADIGRPIDNFAQKFSDGDLIGKSRAAIERLVTSEDQVRTGSGKEYSLRVQPYRTADNRIGGAVASFIDVTELRVSAKEAEAARDYAEAIIGTIRDPLLVLTGEHRGVSANTAFFEMFSMRPADIEGRRIFEVRDGQWDTPELRELLERRLPDQRRVDDFAFRHELPDLGKRILMINARQLPGDGKRPDLNLLVMEDVTERRAWDEHRDMLVGELSHRVKNTLAVVQSLAARAFRTSDTLAVFGETFLGRLQALSRAHDVALESRMRSITIERIVRQAIAPFEGNRMFDIAAGPEIELKPDESQSLAMILYEFATNAIKHGALSVPAGHVRIAWRVRRHETETRLVLEWTESGGPIVRKPSRTGQGMRFVQGSAAHDLNGEATLTFAPEGLQAALDFPLTIDHGARLAGAEGPKP